MRSHRRGPRVILLFAVALLVAACGGECSAPAVPQDYSLVEVALYLQDGQPAALFQTCDGLGARAIHVSEEVDSAQTPWPVSFPPAGPGPWTSSPSPEHEFYFRSWDVESL